MPAAQIRFTKRSLEALPVPERGQVEYKDDVEPKLRVRVPRSGQLKFFWYGKVAGSCKRVTIGPFPQMTVEQARTEAQRMTLDRAMGREVVSKRVDPADTIGACWELWWNARGIDRSRARLTERNYQKHIQKQFGRRSMEQLRPMEIESWHKTIGRLSGQVTANRALELLSSLYNFSEVAVNPCRRVRKFPELPRERFLSADELSRLWATLDDWLPIWPADVIRILLWTGQRKSCVSAMRWDEVDLAEAVWRIPARKEGNKAKRPVDVYLADQPLQLLAELYATARDPFVFPSTVSKGKPARTIDRHWYRIREAAGIPDVRLHDLRRTFATLQHNAGVNQLMIANSLGQKSTNATPRYSVSTADQLRANAQSAVRMMTEF